MVTIQFKWPPFTSLKTSILITFPKHPVDALILCSPHPPRVRHLKNEGRSIFPRSSHYSISVSLRKQGTKTNFLEATWKEWFPQQVLPASAPQAQAPLACWDLDKRFVPGDFQRATLKSQQESNLRPKNAHCTVATWTASLSARFSKDIASPASWALCPWVPGPSPPRPWVCSQSSLPRTS